MPDTLTLMTSLFPLHYLDGYLPLEDHGLIGDGTTAALVGRDGAMVWLCVPRFDAPPLFCRLLDATRGGAFTVSPEELLESRQSYEDESVVLVTEMRGPSGMVRVIDALTFRAGADLAQTAPAGRGELLRAVQVLHGCVRLRIEVKPRAEIRAERIDEGFQLHCTERPELDLRVLSTQQLLLWLPNVVVALVVLVIGGLAAGALSSVVSLAGLYP